VLSGGADQENNFNLLLFFARRQSREQPAKPQQPLVQCPLLIVFSETTFENAERRIDVGAPLYELNKTIR